MNKFFRNLVDRLWDKVFIICGVLGVLLPSSPLNMPFTYRDSGAFLYIGWRILNGELPYRDIWDHKPPIIFYINALGLAISNNSRWGVWLIEFIALFLAAFIGFRLIKKTFGTLSAVFSLFLWMLTLLFLNKGGNYTTEYTLPLQFAVLWLINEADRPYFSKWHWMLIGLSGAIAFFTKQTTIGIWIAIILYLTLQRLKSGQAKRWLRELLFISIGGFAFSIGIIIFFGVAGALPQFWSAAFKYNFVYSASITDFSSRLEPVNTGIKLLSQVGLLQFSIIGVAFAAILVLFKKNGIVKGMPLLAIGLIDLPIELLLVSASGESYPHYYLVILPALSLFAGLTFWVFLSQLSSWKIPNSAEVSFALIIYGFLLCSSLNYFDNMIVTFRNVKDDKVIDLVRSVTAPDDYVLLWGAESSVNFFAQRRSPTRFVYQYPLYLEGYEAEKMIEEFLGDVIRNRPQLIIDTENSKTPFLIFPIQTDAIKAEIEYLKSHYRVVKKIGDWTVYKYRN